MTLGLIGLALGAAIGAYLGYGVGVTAAIGSLMDDEC